MNKTILKIIIVAVVIGGVGFYGGMKYGQSTASQTSANLIANFRGQQGGVGMTGRGANRLAGQNGGFTGGQIIAKDATGITVKLQDNSSKIVFISSSSNIMKSTQGSLSDLVVGGNVTITGTANSDGSITAQSIQIRPVIPQ